MARWFSDVFRVPWELSLEIPGKFKVCLNPEEHAGAEEICRWMAWRGGPRFGFHGFCYV
jgi:hypothetical protein